MSALQRILRQSVLCLPLLAAACLTIPVEVKPMHITVDVNVRVDRQLDDFFKDLDEQSGTLEYAP